MVELARTILEAGVSEAAVRRTFHLYADNLRRLATAEASSTERRWRRGSGKRG